MRDTHHRPPYLDLSTLALVTSIARLCMGTSDHHDEEGNINNSGRNKMDETAFSRRIRGAAVVSIVGQAKLFNLWGGDTSERDEYAGSRIARKLRHREPDY